MVCMNSVAATHEFSFHRSQGGLDSFRSSTSPGGTFTRLFGCSSQVSFLFLVFENVREVRS